MGVGFASYEIARSGLYANERGLFVTGHNIANVNTPGYVRQQAILKEASVQTSFGKYGLIQLGLGTGIQEIRQIRHTFLDNIYRQENTTLGYWETRQKTFQDVQAIMAEPLGSGLQDILNQFWDSWQELSKEPDSLTVRAVVRQRSEALVQKLNHLGEQLDRLQKDLNSELIGKVNEFNEITRKIADLNVTILKCEVNGDSANDYRDQRNYLIDRLTKLAKVDILEMQDGQIDITIDGYYVVQKGVSTDIYAAERSPGDQFYVIKHAGSNVEIDAKSGVLKGLLESRGEVSGIVGSYENGTPNTKTDVTFVLDISDESSSGFTAGQFADIKEKIIYHVEQLNKTGLDYNVRIITTCGNNVIDKYEYGKSSADLSSLISDLNSLNQMSGETMTDNFTTVLNELGNPPYRPEDNKYAVIFTNDSVDATEESDYISILSSKGVKLSVVTGSGSGWEGVTESSGGKLYTGLASAADIGLDINRDVSAGLSAVPDSLNIVSDMKKRLNAMINIMLREINYLHRSGMTMKEPPTYGEDLFIVKNSGRPLEMGNIQLNPNLSDLSNIAASKTGNKGDNSNALDIANLRNKEFLTDITGVTSIDGYYQAIILHMANNSADADRITESQSKLVLSVDASRTSISGVSMDEEMANMLKFKFAYDAASRVLNIMDSMMETIINRMGLAGR